MSNEGKMPDRMRSTKSKKVLVLLVTLMKLVFDDDSYKEDVSSVADKEGNIQILVSKLRLTTDRNLVALRL
jgi:hypothetical protein